MEGELNLPRKANEKHQESFARICFFRTGNSHISLIYFHIISLILIYQLNTSYLAKNITVFKSKNTEMIICVYYHTNVGINA